MSSLPSQTRLTPAARRALTGLAWAALAAGTVTSMVLALTLAVEDAGSATREVLFNVGRWLRWLLYLATFAVFAVLATGPLRRSRLWRLGRGGEKRWDRIAERARVFLLYGIGQGRLSNDLYAAVMHLFIFWGWVVLFIGTLIIALHADVVYFLEGRIYLAYSSVLDVFGIVAFIGLSMALLRRYVLKPDRLRLGSLWDDSMLLWLMLAIVLSGFVVEGLRIATTELTSATIEAHGAAFLDNLSIAHNQSSVVANPDWAPWSPAGYALAELFQATEASRGVLLDAHAVAWWLHLPMALLWTAWVGYGKISHIILGSANIFMRNLSSPRGVIAGSALAPIEDFEHAESFGSGYVADLTWKQLMDADVCVRCGRCEVNCPAHISGKELSPMALLNDIKVYLDAIGPSKLEARAGGHDGPLEGERLLAGDVISVNTIWDCVTCGACETQCPIMIEHIGTLQDMRRYRVLTEADMPPTAQAVLNQIEQRGHPWRGTTLTRTTWMQGLEVPEFSGAQEYLYWVGCSGALVERNLPITRAVARLLTEADVSFGCLGEAETCTGDPARRIGNEYLAQMQIRGTLEVLKAKGVQKVITNCPHCFNTLRNEYPYFGGEFEVYHHTQLLADLVEAGRLTPKTELAQKVTYHDSCYLGRHNGEYEAPRKLIEALPNVSFVEMPRNGPQSFCCGAGGGHMFIDESQGQRINQLRSQEAQSTGAQIVGTNCPFCVQMFDDGIAAVEPDETKRARAMDLAELLELTVLEPDPTKGNP